MDLVGKIVEVDDPNIVLRSMFMTKGQCEKKFGIIEICINREV
jgi:hypothetical protein